MPKRVALGTIIVQRDGKRVQVPVGEVFDFTAEELADIKRLNPTAIRTPVNEDAGEDGASKKKADADKKADATKTDAAL